MADNSQSSTAGGAGGGAPGPSGPTQPRDVYLESERYFMAVALLSAKRSRDPSTQVGACVVNQEKKVVGVGYNKMPNGCEDKGLPWARDDPDKDELKTKYIYVCHAELNAIVDSRGADLKGCSLYTTLYPCNESSKIIIQSGITEVIYLSDKYKADPEMVDSKKTLELKTKASKKMLELAGVQTRKFNTEDKKLEIDFTVQ